MARKSLLILAFILGFASAAFSHGQKLDDFDRERSRMMLKMIQEDLEKHYYDPNFKGVDIERVFRDAEQGIKQSNSLNRALGLIAAALDSLNDSHTFFLPPSRPYRHDYGWRMAAVGDRCLITAVRPGSDAEAKGVKSGDEVLAVGDYALTRDLLWKMRYATTVLRPQPTSRLTLRSPGAQPRMVEVAARMKQRKKIMDFTVSGGFLDVMDIIREGEREDYLLRQRTIQTGDLLIWKMPRFDMTDGEVDDMMGKVRKHKALILDLRGNPGGYVDMLNRLLGYFFEQDVKVGEWVGRKKRKPQIAKTQGKNIFTGKLIVLVDGESASAAEILARVVQLERRGTVLGDRTSGSVMVSRSYGHQVGVQTVLFFGTSITESDLIMADGKSLEHAGVIPDELVLPTSVDLAAQQDPVLTRAAALLGVTIPPKQAGQFFPIEWRKE